MAEIAIISQDFCSLQELQNQNEDSRIDYKSTSPWIAAQYLLGPRSSIVTSYRHPYGFMRKVSPDETRTGNLKITRTAQYTNGVTVEYPTAILDMDGNRVINLADADMGNIGTPAGVPHHAVNLRVADQRYIRKESWSTDANRTMDADLLFNGTKQIKNTINNGSLTVTAANNDAINDAKIILNSATKVVDIKAGLTINTITTTANNTIATAINNTTLTINNTVAVINNTATSAINNTTPTNNFTGDLYMNVGDGSADGSKRIVNIRSYPNYNDVAGTSFDRDPISIKDFKRHQKCNNFAGGDDPSAKVVSGAGGGAYNLYTTTTNGVHQMRRLVGGANIQLNLDGGNIVINNIADLAITLDRTGLDENGITARLGQLFPPGEFSSGTDLRVILDTPNSGKVGKLAVSVSDTRSSSCYDSITRGNVQCYSSGGVSVSVSVPDTSQPVYNVAQEFRRYVNNGASWVRAQ